MNNFTLEGRGGVREGVTDSKMEVWGNFQGVIEVTRGGRDVEKLKNGVTSFMNVP